MTSSCVSEEEMSQFWQLPEAGHLTVSHTRVPEVKFFKATETKSKKRGQSVNFNLHEKLIQDYFGGFGKKTQVNYSQI